MAHGLRFMPRCTGADRHRLQLPAFWVAFLINLTSAWVRTAQDGKVGQTALRLSAGYTLGENGHARQESYARPAKGV